MSEERDPAPAPWGPPAGVVVAAILFFVLQDLDLWVRIAVAFVAIAAMTWLSLVLARRRH
ncbi:MAG TPA: hypothetical protein VF235_09395 [Actinomycetota bacterium]